ncbi:hypothetical protein BSLG_002028 [Batrachochytrium salamandrivorans]|nr:hypothetical protein BSLG_002028 [Batrachochytrium salamandrivorans]
MSDKSSCFVPGNTTPARKPTGSVHKKPTSRSGSGKQSTKQMTLMSFLSPSPMSALNTVSPLRTPTKNSDLGIYPSLASASQPPFESTTSPFLTASNREVHSKTPLTGSAKPTTASWPPRTTPSSAAHAAQVPSTFAVAKETAASPLKCISSESSKWNEPSSTLVSPAGPNRSHSLVENESLDTISSASSELQSGGVLPSLAHLSQSLTQTTNVSSDTPLSDITPFGENESLGLKRSREVPSQASFSSNVDGDESDEGAPISQRCTRARRAVIYHDEDENEDINMHISIASKSDASITNTPESKLPRLHTTMTPKTPTKSPSLSRYSQASTPPSASSTQLSRSFALTNSEKKRNIKDADKRSPEDVDYDPRTLYIPPGAWANFTAFEKQFWEIKATHWDTVVFFKREIFELYEKDADIGHQKFDLKLTDRVNMRMVGVPESSFDHWAAQFIAKGFKVAKVEQMENSIGKAIRDRESTKKEDKIIRRELTSVLTAGTLVDAGLLTNDLSTYCMAIREEVAADHLPPTFGICFVDTASAEFSLCTFVDDADRTKFTTLIMQIKPTELVLEKGMVSKTTMRLLKNNLENPLFNFLLRDKEFWDDVVTMDELNREGYFKKTPNANSESESTLQNAEWPPVLLKASTLPLAMSAFGGLLSYLRSLKLDTNLVSAGNFHMYDPIRSSGTLILDGQTLMNLEVFQNSSDLTDKGTLFKLLNQCSTPFGKRLFKSWFCHPLRSVNALNARLDAIDDLSGISGVLDMLRVNISKLPDLERIVARIHTKSCLVKDFVTALASFDKISALMVEAQPYVVEFKSTLLGPLFTQAFNTDLDDMLQYFKGAFNHRDAFDEGKIRLHSGYDENFDAAEAAVVEIEGRLNAYLRECEKKLNYKGISFKDMGKEIFQMEVPVKVKVPADWTVMSNTKAVNRYYTPKSRDLITEMIEARERREETMRQIKSVLFEKFNTQYHGWMKAVRSIAELDCLIGLSICRQSMPEPVCRPEFVEEEQSVLELEELRHPCVMQTAGTNFIANDTRLGGNAGDSTMILLTGPNMTCIAVIMAQLGSYVPARKCRLTPFDRVFTRIGASDNIMAGQSTFMVELSETSKILREATPRSLVILDELGRGTSTYDGYAIAYAVLNHLVTDVRCLGLFSTHYGTLTKEFQDHPLVALMYMSFFSDEVNKQVTFLYKLTSGSCPKSYGMNVASLANVPLTIVERAEEVAKSFEENQKNQQIMQKSHIFSLGSLISFTKILEYTKRTTLSSTDRCILAAHCHGLARYSSSSTE